MMTMNKPPPAQHPPLLYQAKLDSLDRLVKSREFQLRELANELDHELNRARLSVIRGFCGGPGDRSKVIQQLRDRVYKAECLLKVASIAYATEYVSLNRYRMYRAHELIEATLFQGANNSGGGGGKATTTTDTSGKLYGTVSLRVINNSSSSDASGTPSGRKKGSTLTQANDNNKPPPPQRQVLHQYDMMDRERVKMLATLVNEEVKCPWWV